MFEEGEIVRISQDSGFPEIRGEYARVMKFEDEFYKDSQNDGGPIECLSGAWKGRKMLFIYLIKLSPLEQLAFCSEDSDV